MLLCARREWSRHVCRAAKKRDELSPSHSITLSARSSGRILPRLWNPAAKGGADNAGERNHRQHADEPPQREGDGAAGNAAAAAKKGAGVDNAGTLSRLRGRKGRQ